MHIQLSRGGALAPLAFAVPLAITLAGCGGSPSHGDDGGMTGCDPDAAAIYPCGPYGRDVGQVIANLSIGGTQRDDNKNGSAVDDPVRTVTLADYHDRTLKLLVMLVAAEWCQPCQNEQPELVAAYHKYQMANAGVAMLEAIVQKSNSSPADASTTMTWATHFMVPFDMTFDAQGALAAYSDPTTFPAQLIIRTSDMTIQYVHNGYVPGELEQAIDAVLTP